MERLTTARKVEWALKNQGRKKTWLAEKLGMSRPTLNRKLKDNTFSVSEIYDIQKYLGV